MIYKDFKRLFTKREIQEINGKKRKNLAILTGILFGTFLAIAISDGGIEYLGLKMNDPFVQNLEIEVPYYQSKEVESIKLNLNSDSLKSSFLYDTVLAIAEYPRVFLNKKRNDFKEVKGQSIEYRSPILKQILGKKNKIFGRGFEEENDCGIIVTEKFLSDFGYSPDELFVQMQVNKKKDINDIRGYLFVPVPIIAVVKELPGLSSFVFTPYFLKMITDGFNNPYDIEEYDKITIFVPGEDEKESSEIRKSIRTFLTSDSGLKSLAPIVNFNRNNDTYIDGHIFDISFSSQFSGKESLDSIYGRIINYSGLKNYANKFERYYNYNFPAYPQNIIGYDKISVSFRDLSKVGKFKDYLFKKTGLVAEMSKIKDKENFRAISILTATMASLLLIFSVISVGLFIFNLLKTHLDKIKTNLGTFKAFGLSNKDLQSIYKNIVRRFYLKALLIGYTFATILDVLISIILFPELKVFHLINPYSLSAIVVIWSIIEWVFYQTSRTILINTPGDLIYGRDHI